MSDNIQFLKGTSTNLSSAEIKENSFYLTTDTYDFYYSDDDSNLIRFSANPAYTIKEVHTYYNSYSDVAPASYPPTPESKWMEEKPEYIEGEQVYSIKCYVYMNETFEYSQVKSLITHLDIDSIIGEDDFDMSKHEPEVPINDLYKVFQSYWNAVYKYEKNGQINSISDPFVYASVSSDGNLITDDSTDAIGSKVSNAGRRNGMAFNSKYPSRVARYKFSSTKKGQPINCSTIVNLVTLGIPYAESKYNKELNSYNIKEMISNNADIKNNFNPYGEDIIIDDTNYLSCFITPNLLNKCAESDLEISAIRYDWTPKNNLADSWYDGACLISDLREAKPGDIIFWNNDGETKLNPRDVSHCVLVLDRISYDSTNPNQPLLLLAEATSASSTGIQVSYYMYDDRNLGVFTEDTNGKYLKIQNISSNVLFSKDHQKDKYLKFKPSGETEYHYVQVNQDLNGFYYVKSSDIASIRYDENKNLNATGNFIKIIQTVIDEETETPKQEETYLQINGIKCTKEKTVQGTNEHKIPKFIIRPKYKRLANYKYHKPKALELDADYKVFRYNKDGDRIRYILQESGKYIAQKYIETNGTYETILGADNNPIQYDGPEAQKLSIKQEDKNRRLYTIVFDWTPSVNNSFLSIKNSLNGTEILRHYIPGSSQSSGNKRQNVKIIIPLGAAISTSKQDEIANMENHIVITENIETVNPITGEITVSSAEGDSDKLSIIDNIKIYEGIIGI